MLTLSRYHAVSPPIESAAGTRRVLFSTRSAALRMMDEKMWQDVVHGGHDALPAREVADLVDAEILVPADENELSVVLGRNRRATAEDDTLGLVVMPTASCQLGCGYCGQEHTSRWLVPEHQEQFLRIAERRLGSGRYRHLFVRWFGGEPLSGLRVIRTMSGPLSRLAAEHGCTYGARIVTNGLALTPRVAAELVREHSVRMIDITLDGTRELHDDRRHRKNGRPTFDRIFTHLVALAKSDLDVQIRVRTNVDATNYQGVTPLLELLAAEGIQDRIQYYAAPVHGWGNDAASTALSAEDFATLELGWFCDMIRLGFRPGLVPGIKRVVCMAVEKDSVVVDAAGTLYNCTEVPYVPAYGTPNRYAIGDVGTGEVAGRRNLLGDFNDRVERAEYPCARCPMLPVCGGACPKSWADGEAPCPSALHNIGSRLSLVAAVSPASG